MSDPRLTEERLRNHLDSNQLMRERLCLAVLPLVGPYTYGRPRRPKGGPDGGRDLEAVHSGSLTVWGAVGFRNGGGNDSTARADAQEKFRSDLARALEESPALQGFVFFTNVDLTPGIIDELKAYANKRGVAVVDIVDLERLRVALDSPEGMIARLQYLDIPMSPTEQIALVNKFGNQLQDAIHARFDRVERTLSQLERFLVFQRPLHRFDFYVSLTSESTSAAIGSAALRFEIGGLQDLSKRVVCLCLNQQEHPSAVSNLVTRAYFWLAEKPSKLISFLPSVSGSKSLLAVYCELSLTTSGNRVRLADLSAISLKVHTTEAYASKIGAVAVDLNGYEIFKSSASLSLEPVNFDVPDEVPFQADEWFAVIEPHSRNLLFDPPFPSGRYAPLMRL